MNIITVIYILMMISSENSYKIDFGLSKEGQDWMIVNDDVMGGLSESTITFNNNSILFKGNISLRNNGGFASIRGPKDIFNLSNFTKVKIKFKSKGRDFAFRLATSELYFKPNYKHNFSSTSQEWEIAELKLADFKEYTLGKISGTNLSKQKMRNIIRFGVMLNDKKEGPFEIEIDYIEFK